MPVSFVEFSKLGFKRGDTLKVVASRLFEKEQPQEFIGKYLWTMGGQKDTLTIVCGDKRPCFEFPLISVEKIG